MARQAAALALFVAAAAVQAPALDHRVWLPHAGFTPEALAPLRAAGVDGLVVPVGGVAVGEDSARLTLVPLGDLSALTGWRLAPLLWLGGEGKARGGAATLVTQLQPVLGAVPGSEPVILGARAPWEGLVPFAADLEQKLRRPVEVAVAVQLAAQSWRPGVRGLPGLVAFALGNPVALGLAPATLADQLEALASLDEAGVRYRVAVAVAPRASPPPGPAGASLGRVASPLVSQFQPRDSGDAFLLERPVDWGGTTLGPGETVEVEVVDTARYHRDLGLLLRPVRPGLAGWDTVFLPPHEPALGLSRGAFLDYLAGGLTHPQPRVAIAWLSATRMAVSVENPGPHASAVATTGNWVELDFVGGALLEASIGEFAGAELGTEAGGVWRRAAAADATAVRLFLRFLAPASRVTGAAVSFVSRPRGMKASWALRLGDGSTAAGTAPLLDVTPGQPR